MTNLSGFRKIAVAALWSGLCAGLLLTAVQRVQVIPTLLQAEVYEEQAAVRQAPVEPQHVPAQPHAADWQPENGWERTAYTAIANISLAVGFALLLGAASNLRGGIGDWRRGLLWGLAGYAVFFVAPSLGLPPEVPGTEAAKLQDRQLWWLMTVADTALGLWLLAFAKSKQNKLFGALLLVSPHLMGAPQPVVPGGSAPAALADAFIAATAVANALFWLTLGGCMGLFSNQHHAVQK